MEHWLSDSSLQQMVRILQHHEQSYHRIQRFIEKPPGKLRIFEIFRRSRWPAMRWAADWGAQSGLSPGAPLRATGHRRPVDGAAGARRHEGAKSAVAPPDPAGERQNAFADRDRHRHAHRAGGAAEAAVAAPKIILPGDLPPGEGARCELRLYRYSLPFRFSALYRA